MSIIELLVYPTYLAIDLIWDYKFVILVSIFGAIGS